MPNLKYATWNVNSLRVRLPHLLTWLADVKPDVVALQETKTPDDAFPIEPFNEMGYEVTFSGQKAYNGVAILKREKPLEVITDFPSFTDAQRRVLCVTIGDVHISNFYIPNGDTVTSEKYQYKLNWLKSMDDFVQAQLNKYQNLIIMGDFNIAPSDMDVYDPKAWEGKVLCTPPERSAFQRILDHGFIDCYRHINPEEKEYSWWDYRMNAFKRQMGMRIDHILASKPMAAYLKNCYIDKIPRAWERPSDHAPVIAEFSF